MSEYERLTSDKIALRSAGWTWNRRLRQWERWVGNDLVTAKTMDGAILKQREIAAAEKL